MRRCRLLAIDLDGTLLRDDGLIDPRDSAAIAHARANGIAVTLATGRMPFRTLPFARALCLVDPLVCGDGVVTVLPATGRVHALSTLSLTTRQGLLALAEQTALPLLVLSPDAVLGLREHEALATLLGDWSSRFQPLARASEILDPQRAIVTAFLLGSTEQVARCAALDARDAARGLHQSEVIRVGAAGEDTLRVVPAGVDKGTALSALAHRLGIEREEVAAVGDWYNDLPMLRWAAWSFAMGHAPQPIAQAARRRLRATAATGGAIAELVAELLSP